MKQTFLSYFTQNPRSDILSGLTVALALVPEAVAFSFVAGVIPLIGLYGAFMMGLITALIGGRPGMISGATGAMAVVIVHLVKVGNDYGNSLPVPIEYLGAQWLFICLLLVGLIQVIVGLLRLGKFVRLIPYPVMLGFVNGLAIVIFLSQLELFQVSVNGQQQWITGKPLWTMLALVLGTMLIMYFLPKVTTKIPSALVAIIVISLIVIFGELEVHNIGSFIRESGGDGLEGNLPSIQYSLLDIYGTLVEHWTLLISTAFILAAIGLIESLMTLTLIDDITETRGNGNKECIAQGVGNFTNGIFGGMGGCAMIGQSLINVNSGGRGRLSGIFAALSLLFFILFGSSLIEQIPIASLVGVMFMVVIGTFAWSSFRILHKIPKSDALVLILVSVVTVWQDLAIAVLMGVIFSALVFAWKNATMIRARKCYKKNGTKVYEIWGPLFFGSIHNFNSKFDLKNDPPKVEIDFLESRVSDHSGVEALSNLAERYLNYGIKIKLAHLSPECIQLLLKINPDLKENIKTSIDDPRYYVVTDVKEIN